MKKLYVAAKENGNERVETESIEEGFKLIKEFEKIDKKDGYFEEGFYDIVDENYCSVL